MFASGGKWPSGELPVRTLQCAGLSTGRWMLHNSRRRHLGGMWGMRGGEADQRMREERGWSTAPRWLLWYPDVSHRLIKWVSRYQPEKSWSSYVMCWSVQTETCEFIIIYKHIIGVLIPTIILKPLINALINLFSMIWCKKNKDKAELHSINEGMLILLVFSCVILPRMTLENGLGSTVCLLMLTYVAAEWCCVWD